MDVDLEELAAIIEQLDKTEFTDFLYQKGELHIRVRRGGHFSDPGSAAPVADSAPAQAPPVPAPSAPQAAPAPMTPAPAAGAASSGGVLDPANLPAGHTLVTAPMLGAFYSAPKPGEPAFVQVGDMITEDSVLCIIEVMKLMNSVTAGVAGKVVAVYPSDGDLVEFEQPLFAVEVTS